MDTIILRDLAVHLKPPRDQDPDICNVRFLVQLAFAKRVFDTAGAGAKEPNELEWKAVGTFLVATCSESFTLSMVEYRPNQATYVTAYTEVATPNIYIKSSRDKQTNFRIPIYKVGDTVKETPFAEIAFNAQLVSSNNNGRVTPLSVTELVKTLDMIGIISLLEQISGEDESCINACMGMLNALYSVVHYLPDDPHDRPYALGMLAYIHVVRYDAFIEKYPAFIVEPATRTPAPHPLSKSPYYPAFVIYGHELKRAISMLEDACNIVSPTHEKRSWLFLTLCRGVRSAMMQTEASSSESSTDAASFAASTRKLAKHVKEVGGINEREVPAFVPGEAHAKELGVKGKKKKDEGKIDAKAKEEAVDALLGDYLPGQLEWEKGLVSYTESTLLREKAGLVGYAGSALLRVWTLTKERQFLDEAVEMLEEAVRLESQWDKEREKTDKWMEAGVRQGKDPSIAPTILSPLNSHLFAPKLPLLPGKGKGKAAAHVSTSTSAKPGGASSTVNPSHMALGMGILFSRGVPKAATQPKKPKPKISSKARKGGFYSDLASALIARYNHEIPPQYRDLVRALEAKLFSIQCLMEDADKAKPKSLNILGLQASESSKSVSEEDPEGLRTRLHHTAITAFEDALRIVGGNINEKCAILHHLATALQMRYNTQLSASTNAAAATSHAGNSASDDNALAIPGPNTKDLGRIQTALAKSIRIARPNDPNRLTYIINYGRFFVFKCLVLNAAVEADTRSNTDPRLPPVYPPPNEEQLDAIRKAADLFAEAVAIGLSQRRDISQEVKGEADAPGPPSNRENDKSRQIIAGLHSLGACILTCEKHLPAVDPDGTMRTARRIITLCKDVLRLVDDSDPKKVKYLMDISNGIARYADRLSLDDIKEALALAERARQIAEDDSEDMLTVLHGMASTHVAAAGLTSLDKELVDLHLEAAFPILAKNLELVKLHPEHPIVSHVYSTLGNAYIMRYDRNLEKDNGQGGAHMKYVTDLEDSSNAYRDFVRIAGRTRPEGADWASELAIAYLDRFYKDNDLKDLETAMTRLEWCIFYPRLVPPSVTGGVGVNEPAPTAADLHGRQESIRALFCARFSRFYLRREYLDFKNGMLTLSLLQTLRKAGPPAGGAGWAEADPDGETLFEYLAEYFSLNFHSGNDAEGAVHEFGEQAKNWTKDTTGQPPDKFKIATLMDPLVYLSLRLGRMHGKSQIQDKALDELVGHVKMISDTHIKKATCLQFVGDMHDQHFVYTNNVKHVSTAITLLRDAVRLSRDIPIFPERVTFFGQALLHRFRLLGDMADINEAVSLLQDALKVATGSERVKYDLLNRYGNALYERYGRFQDFEDLNMALQMYQIAKQSPVRYGEKMADHVESNLQAILGNNGDSKCADQDKAKTLFKKDTEWKKCQDWVKLNEYGNALLRRFCQEGVSGDINKAIIVFERALDRAKGDKENKSQTLRILSYALVQRYRSNNDIRDLNRCISSLQDAYKLLPLAHPAKSIVMFDLGRWLPLRYESTGDSRDLERAYGYLRGAASQIFGSMMWRFRAASLWAYWVKNFKQGDLLSAYRLSMELLPQLTWLGISTPVRQTQLTEAVAIAADAVAAAIQDKQEITAVEWFEQGRSVIWGQLNQLRAPIQDLSSIHPLHAERLQAVTDKLHSMSYSRYDDSKSGKKGEEVGESYHDLSQERDEILAEIRSLGGFQNFMRAPKFNELVLDCRLNGYVIMVNVSIQRCDALVIMPDHSVTAIPLPEFSYAQAADFNQSLRNIIGRSPVSRRPSKSPPDRKTRKRITSEVVFENILSKLWICVVKPILEKIGMKDPSKEHLPRLWWCLNGPLAFLPIHAAGLYSAKDDAPGNKLADFAISSYTPSLAALVGAARRKPAGVPRLLAVGLPEDQNLLATQREIDAIESQSPSAIVKLMNSEATVDNVIARMKDCSFVHFACHGVQKLDNPLDSSLLLTQRSPLSLAKITTLHLPEAQFAFLAACQTAVCDPLVHEESVHLGASIVIAGYRSVIATMWSITDDDGPIVAESVYKHIFRKEQAIPDPADAAYALHLAVQRLRQSSPKRSYISWVPFIHIGV